MGGGTKESLGEGYRLYEWTLGSFRNRRIRSVEGRGAEVMSRNAWRDS